MIKQMIVGVDLGGSKINVILADSRGNIEGRDWRDTLAHEGPEAVIKRIIKSIKQVASGADIAGIGIGAAGTCEASTGIITFSPNLPEWHNIPLKDIIQREFGLPTYLENDATAAVLGEHFFGAGVGVENLVYVSVGTGIGGGVIIGGQLYHGASGSAGEIGHMTIDVNGPICKCGNIGCWETFASGTALAREAMRRIESGAQTTIPSFAGGDLGRVSAESVFLAAQVGDNLARDLIWRTAHYLGVGLVNLVNIFNPQLILIGGGLSQMGPLLLDPALKVVSERAFELPARAVRIELARLGADAGALGAVALVLQKKFST
ncbi:MAG: ROK family protein [Dehalococcoidia bacterium]|nr:ROK family protein [Dehalococcoidia bacterium]